MNHSDIQTGDQWKKRSDRTYYERPQDTDENVYDPISLAAQIGPIEYAIWCQMMLEFYTN